MSYIAMNRFRVKNGFHEEFEEVWRSRESHLKEMQGFREFRLLKGPEGEEFRLYSSHVVWDSREDFMAWTQSQNFRDAHKNAGKTAMSGALMGPPQFEGFETILHDAL
ncbi:MAG: antibiotic biosynthesis monooxygenase [Pseudomonadota bacterium]